MREFFYLLELSIARSSSYRFFYRTRKAINYPERETADDGIFTFSCQRLYHFNLFSLQHRDSSKHTFFFSYNFFHIFREIPFQNLFLK